MGQTMYSEVSRFLTEIPEELFAQTLPKRRAARDASWKSDIQVRRTVSTATFRPGQKVKHPEFGEGIVLNSTGSGREEQVTVAFEGQGIKKFLVEIAHLDRV